MADGDLDVVYARECDKRHEGQNLRLDDIMGYLERIEAKQDSNGNKTMLKLIIANMGSGVVIVGVVIAIVKAMVP